MEKKSKKQEQPKQILYSAVLEIMVPVQIKIKISGESPEQAMENLQHLSIDQLLNGSKQIQWGRLKRIQTKLYQLGTTMMLISRRF